MNAYMAILLGAGTFRLSRAIARCGYLVGFAALLFFSLMHIFVCLRLVEVPQLIQQDVPNAAFLAQERHEKGRIKSYLHLIFLQSSTFSSLSN